MNLLSTGAAGAQAKAKSPRDAVAGRAVMGVVTDVEPLLRSLLAEKKREAGLDENVTAEELHAAAQGFGREVDATQEDDSTDVQIRMERSLPPGVRIEAVQVEREGSLVTSKTAFAFDDIRLLRNLEFFYERGQKGQRPFEGLRFEQTDDALVVEGTPPPLGVNPVDVPDEDLRQYRMLFELDVDLDAGEQNATRQEGARLIWDLNAAQLRDLGQGVDAIRVKYRRS